MKKVGIVSCYFKYNYGSMLQAYALKKFLDNNNIPNETINISNLKDFSKGKRKYYLSQLFNFSFIRAKIGMVKLKFYKKINTNLRKNIDTRTKKYEEFRREYFNLSIAYSSYKELKELAIRRYSNVIVGSDQLWLPVNVVADYYTLNWVPDNINKVSYATSFGISSIHKKYKKKYSYFLSRINYLSVREEDGVKLAESLTNRKVDLVADPTLLLTCDDWNEIIPKEKIIKEKYILCYFLGNTIDHRKFAEKLKEETGYKIVSLNHADEYVKYNDIYCDIAPYDIGPKEWINLIGNSEIVLTDSFHCTVFSLLNNKKFFTFRRYSNTNSRISTNSRLDSLLDIVDLKDRILTGKEDINDIIKLEIDYKKVNKKLDAFRKKSRDWLLNSIVHSNESLNHVAFDSSNKEDCCGCSACANVCPRNAIIMTKDEEGFLYPKVDKEKCINCGLCKKVCRITNGIQELAKKQHAYILQNKDEEVLKESTSGGAFSAIADFVLSHNGIVFGAAFDNKFSVNHIFITKKEDLYKFRNSKYVQSNMKDTYKKVKEFLKKGKLVCFSGTPCQVEGLQSFLKKDYENLILVDIECRAVPSPKMFEIYKETRKEKYGIPQEIRFRDKKEYGYEYSQMVYKSKSNYEHSGVETNPYLRAFFSGLSVRPSCYACKFKKKFRQSDITMWDFFDVYRISKSFDNNKGVTRLLTHTQKGNNIIKSLKNVKLMECEVDEILKGSKELTTSVNYNSNRKLFFKDMNEMTSEKFIDKWFKDGIKVKIERFIRYSLKRLGVYSKIKKIVKKIIRR